MGQTLHLNTRKYYFMKKIFVGVALIFTLLLMAGCGAAQDVTTPDSLGLSDGQYQVKVVLSGGSGRASVDSPAQLRVKNGQAFATIVWSSPNYDYMKVDDVKYQTVNTGGNSTFEIPVSSFDCEMPIIADTVAMSEPHEIDYTLQFDSSTITATEEVPAA